MLETPRIPPSDARRFAFRRGAGGGSGRGLGRAAVVVVLAGAASGTVIGFAGAWSWFFDLFSHFRVQYAVALLAAAAGAAALCRWPLAAAAGGLCAVNVAIIAPAYWGGAALPATAPRLTVLIANVQRENGDHERLARLIRERDADVVALIEVDQPWLDDLAPALAGYGEGVTIPQDDNFGIALYSKRPLGERHMEYFGADLPPSIVATVDVDGTPLTLVVTHAPPPVGDAVAAAHARQLAALAAWVRGREERVVVVGDLNSSPWSSRFRRLLADARLRDSRRGFGVQVSFPTGMPLLWIPIDHCLVSAGVGVAQRRVERHIGSDHYPISVELAIVDR